MVVQNYSAVTIVGKSCVIPLVFATQTLILHRQPIGSPVVGFQVWHEKVTQSFFHYFPNFYGGGKNGKKFEIRPRFSTSVAYELSILLSKGLNILDI